MSLAVLRVAPDLNDPRSIDAFSFSNQDEHQRLVRAIAVQGGAVADHLSARPYPGVCCDVLGAVASAGSQ